MARPLPDSSRLTLLLQARGVLAGRDLTQELDISTPTMTRLIGRLGASVERMGAARNVRYALRRPVRNLGSQWPIYRIGDGGRPRVWGELRALHGGFRLVPASATPAWMGRDYPEGLFSGLPFFLQEVRPQGYLGRAIARYVASRLGAPADLRLWSDDDVLTYFLTDGGDLPGDLVVGDRALEHAIRAGEDFRVTAIADADRAAVYPSRAEAAQRGELVGSSAGGEQPKFLTTVLRSSGDVRSVLVKFSAAQPSPVSQRWADLLLCEHLAAEIMRSRQIPSVQTEVFDSGGRRFLEVERFDRIGNLGRRGLLSLGTVEDAFLSQPSSDWAVAAGMLQEEGWISAEGARLLRWTWCFGDLIANSDMHRANASFWFGDDRPYQLTPFYDMLPMLYAPGAQGELAERPFAPRPSFAAVADVWNDAAGAALAFWQRVASDTRVSESFRAIATSNREGVQRLVERFA